MDFKVVGPVIVKQFETKKLITNDSLNDIVSQLNEDDSDLVYACGCYVFAVRNSKGIIPWYVGQANKTTLVHEALNPSNREKYTKVMSQYEKGTPVLYFLPQVTPSGNYSKPTKKAGGNKSINFLEEWLIATGLQKNPYLINEKKTAFLRRLHVTGLFNPTHGGATTMSNSLKKTLGL